MASTVPAAKSQPLHNFSSLSCLKWNRHPRNHRSATTARRSSSPRQSAAPFDDSQQRQSSPRHLLPSQRSDLATESLSLPSPLRQSSISGGCCDGSVSSTPSSYSSLLPGPGNDEAAQSQGDSPIPGGAAFESDSSLGNKKSLIEYRRQSRRNSVPRTENSGASPLNHRSVTPEEDQSKEPLSGNQQGKKEARSSRILIKLPPKEKKDCGEIKAQEELTIHNSEIQEDEKPVPKTWNFRPRKKAKPVIDYDGRTFKNFASVQEKVVHSTQVKRADVLEADKGKKKRGFSISLSREEIEADLFALMGSKPRRRPKKRSKTTQEIIESLLPGSWLPSITAHSYKVSHNSGKG